jgi:hypothetical protein
LRGWLTLLEHILCNGCLGNLDAHCLRAVTTCVYRDPVTAFPANVNGVFT